MTDSEAINAIIFLCCAGFFLGASITAGVVFVCRALKWTPVQNVINARDCSIRSAGEIK